MEASGEYDMHNILEMVFLIIVLMKGMAKHSTKMGKNVELNNILKLMRDINQPLYLGCQEFSTLSIIVLLYHISCSLMVL